MGFFKTSLFFAFMLLAGTCWGYGGGGGSTSCKKPQFSHFAPAGKSEVAPGAQFSVLVAYARPDTIRVTVKQQPVAVTVTPRHNSYLVTGVLPGDLKGTYARINISASGTRQCKGSAGWLVKITD